MMKDKNIEEELRKAYDMMTPEQIDENLRDIEIQPLSSDSEQRIKAMIKEKIRKADGVTKMKNKSGAKRFIAAAAALIIVFAGVAALSSENVRASVAKLFGFVPGVGVVEVENDGTEINKLYILDGLETAAEDEMVSLEIKSALLMGDKLELRYTAYLKKITDEDLEKNINTLSDMYFSRGYNKYFAISPFEEDMYQPLTPVTGAVFNGTEINPTKTKVTETESMESARSVCITQSYDIKGMTEDGNLEGALTLGDLNVDFKMKKIPLDSSAEGAAGVENIIETDGVKIMYVPTLKENKLYIDYYVLDDGGFEEVQGVRGLGNKTDCLTVGETEVFGWTDESSIFESESSSNFCRFVYDLDVNAEENDTAVMDICGIYVEKAYENKGIYFDRAPADRQTINETVDLDGIEAEISEVSVEYFGEEQGYEDNDFGYLVLRYSVKDSDDVSFAGFAKISVNGEAVEGFYVEGFDIEYRNLVIPLPVPSEEVRSVEFESANLLLAGNMSFEIPLG